MKSFSAPSSTDVGAPRSAPDAAEPCADRAADPDVLLWYRQPAREWLEALPVGNGRLGAMVFGGTEEEVLQLNEDTLWAGGPHDYADPRGLDALPRIRDLVFREEWEQAQKLIDAEFMGIPALQMSYQPVGSLRITFPEPDEVSDYHRTLDLDEAVTTVRFTRGGVRHRREVFVSAADQVVVMRLSADVPGHTAFTVAFESPQRAACSRPDPNTIALDGVGGDEHGLTGEIRFRALCRVLPEGRAQTHREGDTLRVTGADSVTLLVAVETSHRSWQDAGGDPRAEAARVLEAAAGVPYATLRARHLREHRALFRRSMLTVPPGPASGLPTDERVRRFGSGEDPRLVSLHYHYGRYLLISSSRPGTQPANLQGLWNDLMAPPWGSKYTVNINTQMNYWPAGPANLVECWDPLFDLLRELAESGRRTARVMYGARGWVAHHNTDLWRGTAPVDGAFWGMWPTGGAWLSTAVWDRYRFTGDVAHLARHYGVLEGAVEFFLDTLVADPATGRLVTCPSVSPENAHHHTLGASVCAGPAMDQQILRDLFEAYMSAADVLDTGPGVRDEALEALRRLAPGTRIGARGQLQEWQRDWDDTAEPGHRHLSHLYALHPGARINPRDTPELAEAARRVLEQRGDEATGWSTAWKLNLWARLGDGDRAHRLLARLLTPGHTAPNLFDLHPPFQIDGNFGAVAGIAEMLLHSHAGELHLLPALPAALPEGDVRGLRARGGAELDIRWRGGRLTEARLRSLPGGRVILRHAGPLDIHGPDGGAEVHRPEPDVTVLDTRPGAVYRISRACVP